MAGTGAGYDSDKVKMMQKAFSQAGFHVVSLSSPTHPNFIVAASSSGMPGDIRSDVTTNSGYIVPKNLKLFRTDSLTITIKSPPEEMVSVNM